MLSIEDHVTFLDGRKIKRLQESPRWIDAYTVPGQFVAVRYPPDPVASASASNSQNGACSGLLPLPTNSCRTPACMPVARGTPALLYDTPIGAHAEASTSGGGQNGSADGIPTARTLFAISSSPYHARVDSANLDASIIEVAAPPTPCLLHTKTPAVTAKQKRGLAFHGHTVDSPQAAF